MNRSTYLASRAFLSQFFVASRCQTDACPVETCRRAKDRLRHLAACAKPDCTCKEVHEALRHFETCSSRQSCTLCWGIMEGEMDPHVFSVSLLHFLDKGLSDTHAASLFGTCPPTPTNEERCAMCNGGVVTYCKDPRCCDVCAKPLRAVFFESRGYQRVPVAICASCYRGSEFKHLFARGTPPTEPFVRCKQCDRIFHISCVLVLKGADAGRFMCTDCLAPSWPLACPVSAEAVRKTSVAEDVEAFVKTNLARDAAARRAQSEQKDVPEASGLTVRVCHSSERPWEVPEGARARLRGAPASMDARRLCIVLFQKVDGIDVALLCMYVTEYPETAPGPNARMAHIEYIDSVSFFQPQLERAATGELLRTLAYQLVVLGYAASAKKRGISTIYLWAHGLETPNQEYVFNTRPAHQSVPDRERLCSWYAALFDKAVASGVAHGWGTLKARFRAGRGFPCVRDDMWASVEGNLDTLLEEHGDAFFVAHLCKKCAEGPTWPCATCARPSSSRVLADAPLACDVFESAGSLNDFLVQNKLQFDSLKNAKHSTTVMLQQLTTHASDDTWIFCDFCARRVVGAGRWWCAQCAGLDACSDCASLHAHPMRPAYGTHVVAASGTDVDLMVLGHALACGGCQSTHCAHARETLRHAGGCGVLGCDKCVIATSLLQFHANRCDDDRCTVPLCGRMRHGL